jgi:hypothetical protein
MVARRYAAEFGRFLSVDPMADSYHRWSPYVYTLNNPVNLIDPTGMCPENTGKDIPCIDGGVLGEAVVTAQRPGSSVNSFSFATTFVIGAARVGGHTLVRTPNPYAVGAGLLLLGGAIVADIFVETPAERMMAAISESGADAVFPDETELARRLGIPRSELEKKKHGEILKDPDIADASRKLGARNPDIGISKEGNIVLKNRRTGRTIDTGIPLESFKN